jgi:hypothetical protein
VCIVRTPLFVSSRHCTYNRPFDRQPSLSPPSVARRIHRLLFEIGIGNIPSPEFLLRILLPSRLSPLGSAHLGWVMPCRRGEAQNRRRLLNSMLSSKKGVQGVDVEAGKARAELAMFWTSLARAQKKRQRLVADTTGHVVDPPALANSMHAAAHCSATSRRTRQPCSAPAVRGWTVCRCHGARAGAPSGERNGAYRHGAVPRQLWLSVAPPRSWSARYEPALPAWCDKSRCGANAIP